MALSATALKQIRSLQTTKGRREQGCFLIEGEKLVREAVTTGAPIRELLAEEAVLPALRGLGLDVPTTPVSARDAARLAGTKTPQGWFAVVADEVPSAATAIDRLPAEGGLTVVALDGVQDPGNAGALIRVAAAFRVALVLAGPGTADPVHPKVVRAATGAWFQVPIARSEDLAADLETLRSRGFSLLGALPAGDSLYDAPREERCVLVLGSEGGGFSPPVSAMLERALSVPIAPGVESLNVAVAAGIVLGEWERARAMDGVRCGS
jgi:TrmH family RNA methyltransferase